MMLSWAPIKVAVFFWVLLAVDAVLITFLPADITASAIYFVATGLLMLFVIFWWFLVDARATDYAPSRWLKVAVLVLPPFAISYYKYRSAGFVATIRFLAVIVGLYLALIAIQFALGVAAFRVAGSS